MQYREFGGVVLDTAKSGENTRVRGVYIDPEGRTSIVEGDYISRMPVPQSNQLVEHLRGAVPLGPDLDAIDPLTDTYKHTMGMNDSRNRAQSAVLAAVENARVENTPEPDKTPAPEPPKKEKMEIQRGDHVAYRNRPGGIEDGFVREVDGINMVIISMDRDEKGAITSWVSLPTTIERDQIVKHTQLAPIAAINTILNVQHGYPLKNPPAVPENMRRATLDEFNGARRIASKALSKSEFVEMNAAQEIFDKPELDKIKADRDAWSAKQSALAKADMEKSAAENKAKREAIFAEAFDGGPHTLEDNKHYPLDTGDYVAYFGKSGQKIECLVFKKVALPADADQRSVVYYQSIARGGLSGTGNYELGALVAGDISKSSITEHIRDFLPERAQFNETHLPALDDALDKRMQKKREQDAPRRIAKARPVVRQKDIGLER